MTNPCALRFRAASLVIKAYASVTDCRDDSPNEEIALEGRVKEGDIYAIGTRKAKGRLLLARGRGASTRVSLLSDRKSETVESELADNYIGALNRSYDPTAISG